LASGPLRLLFAAACSTLLPGTLLLELTGSALASTAASYAPSSDTLEEVIVTAQKRPERLQDVPISAQVTSAQVLLERNSESLEKLTETMPGVHVSAGTFSNNLFIRGIGSGADNPSYAQSVATFVDDVYFGRSRTSDATFLDVDRVEVLRGPQSTFFGNNATAGALHVVTKKPGTQFEAWGRALYGQFGQYALEGAVDSPLTDTLALRVAATRNGTDRGWIDNVSLNEEVPHINNLAGRLSLAYRPTENLDAYLKLEGSQNVTSGAYLDEPTQYAHCPPPQPITASFMGTCSQALALGLPLGLDNDENSGLPGQGADLSAVNSALVIEYRQWGQTFTAVSGYYNYDFSERADYGLLPVFTNVAEESTEDYHQFSQELRVASPDNQAITYLLGAYFQTDQLEENIDINAPYADFVATLPGFMALAPYLPVSFEPGYSQTEKVYSAFGAASWKATARLKLSVGVRGSEEHKDFNGYLHYGTSNQVFGGFTPIPSALEPLWGILEGPPGTQNVSRTDRASMPSAALQYQLRPQAMAYFSYSRGFKAGGFNGLLPNRPTPDLEFGPEHVNAFELGIKSRSIDGRWLVNLDIFRSDYTGLQANTEVFQPATDTYAPLVRNAAGSRSQGVELEAQWIVGAGLRLAAEVAYLDAYYVSYPNASPTTLQNYCAQLSASQYMQTSQCQAFPYPVPAFQDLSGQPTPYSPRWSGSVTASWSTPVSSASIFTAELLSYFTSSYAASTGDPNDPFFQIDGYVRLDARLTLEGAGGPWAVDVIGKNLTDHLIISNPGEPYFYFASKEMPRNFVAQIRWRW